IVVLMPAPLQQARAPEETTLPVLSLANHSRGDTLADALRKVCIDDGFFYLKDHGISQAAIDSMFDLSSEYFINAPEHEKIKGDGDTGYTAFLDSLMPGAGDMKESFYLADAAWLNKSGRKQTLPQTLALHRTEIDGFFAQCSSTASLLLEGLAHALKLPVDFLTNRHNGEHSRLRMLHYPPVYNDRRPMESNAEDIRAGAHTDYGSITLLFQHGVSGLQVQKGGKWIDVPPIPGSLVINIGDALEFWTCGLFRSTLHRVVMPRTAAERSSRYSLAFFVQPDGDTVLEPLFKNNNAEAMHFDEVIAKKGLQPGTRTLTGAQYLRKRIEATYKQSK
ncbi:MAG: hypothetical protein CYPHOPRED_005212, partial [Cyphobasidiales sp. Tagirdzhanova-0007]